ncbi:unnamed protein product [Closterium sp. NIES-54]
MELEPLPLPPLVLWRALPLCHPLPHPAGAAAAGVGHIPLALHPHPLHLCRIRQATPQPRARASGVDVWGVVRGIMNRRHESSLLRRLNAPLILIHNPFIPLSSPILTPIAARVGVRGGGEGVRGGAQYGLGWLKQHVARADANPLLIFPEGTCVNNEYTVMFKKVRANNEYTVMFKKVRANNEYTVMFKKVRANNEYTVMFKKVRRDECEHMCC